MKNVIKISFFVVLVFFSLMSCDKDDASTDEPITGKWEYFRQGTAFNGLETLVDYPSHTPGCPKNYLNFKADGTVDNVSHNSVANNCEEVTTIGVWTKNGTSLSQTFLGQTVTSEITQLDATTLKVKIAQTVGGITSDFIIVFKRP